MEVLDMTYIDSVSDGDEKLKSSLLGIFKEQLDEFREGFEKMYETEDWYSMAALAHKAKSSISSLGMDELAVAMKKLEMMCKLLCVEKHIVDGQKADDYNLQIKKTSEKIMKWVYDNKSKKSIHDLIFFYILQSEKAKSDLEELCG